MAPRRAGSARPEGVKAAASTAWRRLARRPDVALAASCAHPHDRVRAVGGAVRDAFLGRPGRDLDLTVPPGRAERVRGAPRGTGRDARRLRRRGAASHSQGPVPRSGDRRVGGGGRAGGRPPAARFHRQRARVRAPGRHARRSAWRAGGPATEDPPAAATGRLPRGPAARPPRGAVSGTAAWFSHCARRRSRDQGRWEISSKGVGGETARRNGQAPWRTRGGPSPRAALSREGRRPASTHSKQRAANAARHLSRLPPRLERPSRRASASPVPSGSEESRRSS